MGYGAKSFLEHELFIDLSLPIIEIKSKIRKSFKSLITSGQKLWKVEVMESENIKIWEEFKKLHIKVAGRKTRSDKTWEIHYKDICENKSFLIYLLDNNNEMVGGGLFQYTKDEALYAVAAYDRNQFDKPMGHVIQFRAIEELKKRTASWYKLGGRPFLNGQANPTEKEIKIAEFKHGFSTHLFSRIILVHQLISK
jgi:FemAB family protein